MTGRRQIGYPFFQQKKSGLMGETGEQHGIMRMYREVLKRFITNGGIVAVTHPVDQPRTCPPYPGHNIIVVR